MRKFYLKILANQMSADSYSICWSKTPLKPKQVGVGLYAEIVAEDEKALEHFLSFQGGGFHHGDTIKFVLNPVGE